MVLHIIILSLPKLDSLDSFYNYHLLKKSGEYINLLIPAISEIDEIYSFLSSNYMDCMNYINCMEMTN